MTGVRIRHQFADRGNDLYETPACATRALCDCEQLPPRIWEPAAGRGAIVNVLRGAGHEVVASDLIDYDVEGQPGGIDFLQTRQLPEGVGAIVTNPPFKLANEFVRHALALCPLIFMLLRLKFYEGYRRRNDLLDGGSLARVHVFRRRLPMMHRDGWQGPKTSSTEAFAWFVWDQAHRGPTTLHRISWGDAS